MWTALFALPASGQPFTFTAIDSDLPPIGHATVSLADANLDGYPDLLVSGHQAPLPPFEPLALFALNRGNEPPAALRFESTALPAAVWTGSGSWADIDRDGDADLFLTGATNDREPYQPATWGFRNDGAGGLSEEGPEWSARFGGVLSWADVNNDGAPDALLCGTDAAGRPGTVLLINTGSGTLAPTQTDLPDVTFCTAAWADADGDFDFDVLLAGVTEGGAFVTGLFLNDGNAVFTPAPLELPGLVFPSAAWGDYDGDGDPDLVISGARLSYPSPLAGRTMLYRNEGGSLSSQDEIEFPDAFYGDVSWTDFDLDGDLDLFITGATRPSGSPIGLLYRNVEGAFQAAATLPGISAGNAAWTDLDGDLDQDVVIAGLGLGGRPITRLYRNDQKLVNTRPEPPESLFAEVSGRSVALHWSPGWDEHTPVAGLTYNLAVGSSSGGYDVVSPLADADGRRVIGGAGNVGSGLGWRLTGLAPGEYTWRVQSVDNSFIGSPFSAENRFVIVDGQAPSTDAESEQLPPLRLELAPAFPNPFTASTTVEFVLPAEGEVRLEVFDQIGRRVAVLVDGALRAGRHSTIWRTGTADRRIAPGLYIARLRYAGASLTRTLSLLP